MTVWVLEPRVLGLGYWIFGSHEYVFELLEYQKAYISIAPHAFDACGGKHDMHTVLQRYDGAEKKLL